MEALLTYEEASRRLNIRKNTLYALVSQGRIPHVRLGKRMVRFDAGALDAWIAEHTVGSHPGDDVP